MNIEAVICSYLLDHGIEATVHIPRPRPNEFVSIERTGGNLTDVVLDHPMVAIQSWAQTRYEASELAYEVDDLMSLLPEFNLSVCSCVRNSLYSFPDPESGQPRYQAVYDLVIQN